MRHLFPSTVEILEATTSIIDGARVQSWARSSANFDKFMGNGFMKCRLDLIFLRPNKDQPAPIIAGRSPDRTGVMFCSNTPALQGGQIVHVTAGPYKGSFFLLKAIPDDAQDYSGSHHIEVQVFETNQAGINYPSGAPK